MPVASSLMNAVPAISAASSSVNATVAVPLPALAKVRSMVAVASGRTRSGIVTVARPATVSGTGMPGMKVEPGETMAPTVQVPGSRASRNRPPASVVAGTTDPLPSRRAWTTTPASVAPDARRTTPSTRANVRSSGGRSVGAITETRPSTRRTASGSGGVLVGSSGMTVMMYPPDGACTEKLAPDVAS